ncbi:MAG: transporter substrate-binding domain-containing protein, partial [Actinomycetota bacterium]
QQMRPASRRIGLAGGRLPRLCSARGAQSLAIGACSGASDGPSGDASGALPTVRPGVLTIGSDIPYPPFEFEDQGGGLAGFDVDLVRAVAAKLDLKNRDDDWVSTSFTTIFSSLNAGKFDLVVAAVTAVAPEGSPAAETVKQRREVVDFTLPYYPSRQSLAVAKSSGIKSVKDLSKGDRIGVQRATTGAFWAEQNLAPRAVEPVSFEKAPETYQALQAGQLVGVVNDLPVSLAALKDRPQLEVVEEIETGEQYSMAVAKQNPKLRDAINQALKELFEDGSYARIYKNYFPGVALPDYASE